MAADLSIGPALTGALFGETNGFDLTLARSVVLVYDQSLVPPRATKRHHRTHTHPFRQVGSLAADVDIVVAAGPGAPVAAITIEFLAALGVRTIVTVGQAGLLRNLDTDVAYVVERAESDEGTSRHYSNNLVASKQLTSTLVETLGGPPRVALSTDVPFRHTPARLTSHRNRADFVEMECAAIFSTAHHFGLSAGAVLVPSDTFADPGWRQLESASAQRTLQQAVQKVSRVLAEGS